MTAIMIVSGLFSTMNVWADKWDHIRLSVNDLYMIFLMTGWMLFFMGVYESSKAATLVGTLLVVFCLYGIRTQLFVTERQFLLGMIPHHSMAVHMSKKLQERSNTIPDLLRTIIQSQENEIRYMVSRTKD